MMKIGDARIEAGAVTFALQYRPLMADQGVSIQVVGCIEGGEKELLRFDCFDQRPHYHYDPEDKNERHDLDKTTAGNPISWTLQQLRIRLSMMLGSMLDLSILPGNSIAISSGKNSIRSKKPPGTWR